MKIQRMIGPSMTAVDQGQHWTAYVNSWSTFAAAIGAVAVAIFAFVEGG